MLGLSWGGTLALEFHRLFPQHVRSMIIADSYAGWTGSLGAEDAQARLDRCVRESQLPVVLAGQSRCLR
jgi:pimeloyl-ACP methyl ester carboxylesterase